MRLQARDTSGLAARIAALRAEYQGALPADLADARRFDASGAFQALGEIAHRHAGSAASFGFDLLAAAAREADMVLKTGLFDLDHSPIVDAWLQALEQACSV